MARVLVVDDEKLIVKGIRFSLEQDGYEVDCAYDGDEAIERAKEREYDVVLLDVMLPGHDGFEVCQTIREFSEMPIIMLTAKGDDMDKILGLEYGADDYITKPFNILEVKARIKAIIRRNNKKSGAAKRQKSSVVTEGDLKLDRESRRVFIKDKEINLTAKEFDLLELLVTNPNKVYSRESLLEYVWGNKAMVSGDVRTAYGFMMGHPGKKLLFMGQDFGQMDEWNEKASLEWGLLKYDIHSQMKDYVKALNHLYRIQPALYKMDYEPEGFEWINCTYNDENIVIFERKTDKPEETLLFVCNFAPVEHEKFRIGVPFAGKYKEILNSDAKQFGGSGMVNPRVKMSKKEEWDTRKNSIAINLAPMSTAVFSCTPYEEEAEPEKKKTAEKRKRPARQPSVELPASPLDVISEKVGQIIKTARESRH